MKRVVIFLFFFFLIGVSFETKSWKEKAKGKKG